MSNPSKVELVGEWESPGFVMLPPNIWHAERIPLDVLAAMKPTWDRFWFAPRRVTIELLEDVYVAAQGLVIKNNLEIVESTIKEHTKSEIQLALSNISTASKREAIPKVRGVILLCRKPGSSNYGHWLVELLPKVWLASKVCSTPMKIMIQDVEDPLRSIIWETLSCLGVSRDMCLVSGPLPMLIDKLLLVNGLTEHGSYMSPLVYECLEQITSHIEPYGPSDLLIVRGNVASRRFYNEIVISRRALKDGFSALDPSSISFRAQVAAFKAARSIVGAAGAAMTNTVFAKLGSNVFTLTPANMQDTFFWFINGLNNVHNVDIRCDQKGIPKGSMQWDTEIVVSELDYVSILRQSRQSAHHSNMSMKERVAIFLSVFDPAYYLDQYKDVASARVDPLRHYLEFGWREGRSPSKLLDGSKYLRLQPDAVSAGINPLAYCIMSQGLQK